MELVPLMCLFVVTWGGITSADGPTVITQVVKEDGVAVLNCSLGKNAQVKVFSWWKAEDERKEVFMYSPPNPIHKGQDFRSRVFHFPEALQSGNNSIFITPAKASDSGKYICEIPGTPIETRSIISLIVEKILKDRSPEKILGAAPRPVITLLHQPESMVLLRCEVLGAFPEPHVEWRDSAGTVLKAHKPQPKQPEGVKRDVTLDIIVTKSDNFSCISTQKTIYHEICAQTSAHPIGPLKPLLTLHPQTDDGVPLDCQVHGVSPKTTLRLKYGSGKVILTKKTDAGENGGSYDIILRTTVTESGYYHCVATQEETGLETEMKQYVYVNPPPPPPEPSGVSIGVVAGVAFGVLVVTAVITAVVCVFIKCRNGGSVV